MLCTPKIFEPRVQLVPIDAVRPNPLNARTHNRKQLRLIAKSIEAFGFVNPILATPDGILIAGHGRLEAAKQLAMTQVPVVYVEHLSADEARAYAIADNQLATLAGWDGDILAIELQNLITLPGFEIEVLGFEVPEIDLIIEAAAKRHSKAPEEALPERAEIPITQLGDLWQLGPHRLFCADAGAIGSYAAVMGQHTAQAAFTDPPYNVPISGFVSQSKRHAHREFVAGTGELDEQGFIDFLAGPLKAMRRFCDPGSVVFVAMDWRHQYELISAWRAAGLAHLNTCVWTKDNGGMGSLYRSAHEFVAVLKVPGAKHRNNVELGRHGRNRTNVWAYPSANSFSKANDEGALNALHSTVKAPRGSSCG